MDGELMTVEYTSGCTNNKIERSHKLLANGLMGLGEVKRSTGLIRPKTINLKQTQQSLLYGLFISHQVIIDFKIL